MKRSRWIIFLSTILIIASAVLYGMHYAIFRDSHHIFIYLLGDVAFVPIEVLLVTVVVHQLLIRREMRVRLEKLNMVIGAFFSEVGISLLHIFSESDPSVESIRNSLMISTDWTDETFAAVRKELKRYEYRIDIGQLDLGYLKKFLIGRRDFLVRLMENPTLLEHESFTRLLRAVFHLTEELSSRHDIDSIPESDRKHLAGDSRRAYVRLVDEWLDYMEHLKLNYPYLFSLAMRLNPFRKRPSPIVT